MIAPAICSFLKIWPYLMEVFLYLAVAATKMEMQALERVLDPSLCCERLVTGIGPMETAHRLTRYLAGIQERLSGVVLFGVAGVYEKSDLDGPGLLDICLAEEEVLADFGICFADGIEEFIAPELDAHNHFTLDSGLLALAEEALQQQDITCCRGRFLTVQCASGTKERGDRLAAHFDGLCENMEGAAVARVCAAFSLPCLEVRCISNRVEDRDTGRWRLKEACAKAGAAAAHVLGYLDQGLAKERTP
jgi:futalosine hydrolase